MEDIMFLKKRLFLFLIAFFVLQAAVFALPDFTLSAGGGGLFGTHWKSAKVKDEYKEYSGPMSGLAGFPVPTADTTEAMKMGYFDTDELSVGGGIWAFFDATYVEADVALLFTTITQTVKMPNEPMLQLAGEEKYSYTVTHLNFALLGKYPFTLNRQWTLFPLLGIDGQIALHDKDDRLEKDLKKPKEQLPNYDPPNLADFWNCLWIKAGVGADFNLSETLYIRGEFLYGVKLNSKNDSDNAKYWAEQAGGVSNGPSLKIGLGYRFFKL
jgi:hypothetical protein